MNFFVPACPDPMVSERAYRELHSFVEDSTGWTLEGGRICRVSFRSGEDFVQATVGKELGGAVVNAIFETDVAVIVCRCSPEAPSAPVLVAKRDVLRSEWFFGHEPPLAMPEAGTGPQADGTFFLFTDIEGSTRAWESHPAHMRYALVLHDAILHNAVSANEGHVFNTAGDSFYCAFESGNKALKAAVDAQMAISSAIWPDPLELKVRMVLHFGESLRWNDGYVGAPLNHAANLLGHAHGGQVLLTTDVLANCGGLPGGAQLKHFGDVGLGDLCEPTKVFELLHPALGQVAAGGRASDLRVRAA